MNVSEETLKQIERLIQHLAYIRDQLERLKEMLVSYEMTDFFADLLSVIDDIQGEVRRIDAALSEELVETISQLQSLQLKLANVHTELDDASNRIKALLARFERLLQMLEAARSIILQIERAESEGRFEEALALLYDMKYYDESIFREFREERTRMLQAKLKAKELSYMASEAFVRGRYHKALYLSERALDLDPSERHARRILEEIIRRSNHVRKQYVLSLFAIARAELEDDDLAVIGRSYSVQAGVSWDKPDGFKGEPFDVMVRNMVEPIVFDILFHASDNLKLITEWHKHLYYHPLAPDPQLVEFTFQVIALGPSSLAIDFYHEKRWLRTIRFEFKAVDAIR